MSLKTFDDSFNQVCNFESEGIRRYRGLIKLIYEVGVGKGLCAFDTSFV